MDHYETLRTSGLMKNMLFELLLCSIHSLPKVNKVFYVANQTRDIQYSLDMLCTYVTLTRVYFIWRIFGRYSVWRNERAEGVCNDCHCESGTAFAVKCELKERPYTIIIVCFLISICLFGYAIRAAEIPYMYESEQDWNYIWNSMWCTIITMCTVGYGDFYPSTHLGRFFAILACILGNFLISLMVVSLTVSSEFNPPERKAYDNIIKELSLVEHQVLAKNVIVSLLRYKVAYTKHESKKSIMIVEQKSRYLYEIREKVRAFQQHRKKLCVKD
mmetsp:Transcript_18650/g.17741  ORF Transcript_18650/g.17741 Transcript_18650/m.17741 type:complete len:273 (+) Transcript_18650:327-1145(+)